MPRSIGLVLLTVLPLVACGRRSSLDASRDLQSLRSRLEAMQTRLDSLDQRELAKRQAALRRFAPAPAPSLSQLEILDCTALPGTKILETHTTRHEQNGYPPGIRLETVVRVRSDQNRRVSFLIDYLDARGAVVCHTHTAASLREGETELNESCYLYPDVMPVVARTDVRFAEVYTQ